MVAVMRPLFAGTLLLIVWCLGTTGIYADDRGATRQNEELGPERRVALVIGNSDYEHTARLANPINDAEAMGDSLTELGFEVYLGIDLDKQAFDALIYQFIIALDDADVGLFFYAGHGLQVDDINYLVPVDARLEHEADLFYQVVRANDIVAQLSRPDFMGLVFLDACRNNPLARSLTTTSRSVGRGLAEMRTSASGTLIVYATAAGEVAYDGDGDHSPFTQALLNNINEPNLDVRLMLDDVAAEMREVTDGAQTPWVHYAPTGNSFQFNPQVQVVENPETDGPPEIDGAQVAVYDAQAAIQLYVQATTATDLELQRVLLEQFIATYPEHPLAIPVAQKLTEVIQAIEAARAAVPDPDRDNPPAGDVNNPPVVAPTRTLELDADAGEAELGIDKPSDEDGDDLVITVLELPRAGDVLSRGIAVAVDQELSLLQLGALTYVPDPEFQGSAGVFRYSVDDGNEDGVVEGLLRISLRAPNQSPIIPDVLRVNVPIDAETHPLRIPAPIDPDNDVLTLRTTWLPNSGTIEMNGRPIGRFEELTIYQLTALTYRPDGEATGQVGSFEYEVSDERGGVVRGIVRITIVTPNLPPVLADQRFVEVTASAEGAPLELSLPTDPEGDALFFRITWLPSRGEVHLGAQALSIGDTLTARDFGRLVYVAAAGHSGDAGSFEFEVTDETNDPVRGMVRITVVAPDQPPQVVENQAVVVQASAGAASLVFDAPSDSGDDSFEVTILELPYRGTVTLGNRPLRVGDTIPGDEFAQLRYEPSAGHVGDAGILRYAAADASHSPVVGEVAIAVESDNRAPWVPEFREISVPSGTATNLGLSLPTDPDNDPMTVRILQLPSPGEMLLNGGVVRVGDEFAHRELAALEFRATAVDLASSRFSYEVDDGRGGVVPASVSLSVEPVANALASGPLPSDPGGTLADALDIGSIDGQDLEYTGSVDALDVDDYLRFEIGSWSAVEIEIDGLEDDADLIVWTEDERVAGSSEFIGQEAEEVQQILPPGVYYIHILGYEGAVTPYVLSVSAERANQPPADTIGNSAANAAPLGTVTATNVLQRSERLDLMDEEDWYSFTISQGMTVLVQTTGLSQDMDLELYDANVNFLQSSNEGGYRDEAIAMRLEPGTYYARVYVYSGQSDYTVSVQQTRDDLAGNDLDTATNLGVVTGQVVRSDWVGAGDQNDYYAFRLNGDSDLTLSLTGLAGDADMDLMNGIGEILFSSTNVELADEYIEASLQAGDYYVRVLPYEGETEYQLTVDVSRAETLAELQAWEQGWSQEERRVVQRALALLGHYDSTIDGIFGGGTRAAIEAYQVSIGATNVTGYLSRNQRISLSVDAADAAMALAEAAAVNARSAASAPGASYDEYNGGDTYEGDRGRVGFGVYTWSAGHTYAGEWDGSRDGYGVLDMVQGAWYGGQWAESVFTGFGVVISPDGDRMAGEWHMPPSADLDTGMNGVGIIQYADGSVESGVFRDGVLVEPF